MADDHPVVRAGLAAIIEGHKDLRVVGQAQDGAAAVKLFRELRPDVTLMDLSMPGIGGIEAIQQIRAEFDDARIIVLTTYQGDVKSLGALKAGAMGYVLKSAARTDLMKAIRLVHEGRRYIPPDVASELAAHVNTDPLSAREIEVLSAVAEGKTNREAGLQLGVSAETVKAHMKTILQKLSANDRTHAVVIALKRGFMGD